MTSPPQLPSAHLSLWPESTRFKAWSRSEGSSQIYTMPGIKFEQPIHDKMAQAVFDLTGKAAERPKVDADVAGLKRLISHGCLRAALNLTTTLLTGLGQGPGMASHPSNNTILTFELWSCRFQLMAALKMHSQILEEILPFEELDAPDTYLQFYNEYNSRGYKGSIVPFSLRLIHAEILAYSPDPWRAFDRVTKLEKNSEEALKIASSSGCTENEIVDWHMRLESVRLLKAKIFYMLKDYKNAMAEYESLLYKTPNTEKLLQLVIRLAMTIGNEKKAAQYLEALSKCFPLSELTSQTYLKFVFDGKYEQALEELRQSKQSSGTSSNFTNNEAVCALYGGKVEESLEMLANHKGALVEPIAVNLSTIADLCTTASVETKRNYFMNHCEGVSDIFDPQTIKLV
ncbi:trafficking protein particle complex subunit 12 [Ditylenchus destructor]|nr:trafficking protein particle complex subunit 12 [Ditylenchus destructor]